MKTTNKVQIEQNKKRIVELVQTMATSIVESEEKRVGHVCSGGSGMSFFLSVYTADAGKFRMYANGADEAALDAAFKARLPGYLYMDSTLD